jgi:hypothetical protein
VVKPLPGEGYGEDYAAAVVIERGSR